MAHGPLRHTNPQRNATPTARRPAAAPPVRGIPRYLNYRVSPSALAAPESRAAESRAEDFARGRCSDVGSTHGSGAGSFAHHVLGSASRNISGGAPLPEADRARFEGQLGDDLGDVRLHADPAAGSLADAVGANAFTRGRDVYFGRGKYQPSTPEGERLLSHELAHAAQHGHGDQGQIHADLAMSLPSATGVFEIDFADRVPPARPGMEGHIRFNPDSAGPYSAEIGLIQAVRMIDVPGASTTPGSPYSFAGTAESERDVLGTTGSQGEEVGWHVDTTYADPAKTSGAAVSPSYPQSVGFAATHNEHGWLRSPSDIKQATLYDYPGFSGAIDYDFETVAKGMDNQSVYGAIHWGFQIRNTSPAVGFAPTAEFAYTMPTQSAEFDVALDRFRAFFTHEPVILYFDTDRDTPSPAELGKLADAMSYLSDFSDTHVEVDGFADERGPGGHNAGLAQGRAESVAALLMARGLDAARIDRVLGHGATDAFAAGHNAGTWTANRRTSITFVRNASTPPGP